MFQRYGATIDAVVGMNATAVSPDLSTITFVGAGPQDPGDKDCGEGVPCPRFALYIEDIRKHKAPRILARDAGPASFSNDGKRVAFVARNRIVFWVLANGKSTLDQDRERLADGCEPSGLAAALSGTPPSSVQATRARSSDR